MILVKLHEEGNLLAICDANLVGKKFEEKELQLDINERFYGGEEMEEDKILQKIVKAKSINIVGKESINFAERNNIITKDKIIIIDKIPHAQVFEV